jgi:phage gpG-like protein
MIEIKLTGDRELGIYLKGVSAKTLPAVSRIVGRGALIIKSRAILNVSNKILHRRTGKLANSFAIARGLTTDTRSPFAVIFTNTVYAPAHEFGAIIRPVKAKALAIPFPGIMGSPRSYKDTYIRKGIIFQAIKGKDSRILFVLSKQVRIPKRPFLAPAFTDSIPDIVKIADEELGKTLK